MRRCVEPGFERKTGPVPVYSEERLDKSTGTPFPFRAGYVDDMKSIDIGVLPS